MWWIFAGSITVLFWGVSRDCFQVRLCRQISGLDNDKTIVSTQIVYMANICWLNGTFIPETEARVSAFDRGFIFGDGVYEVTSMLDGTLMDADRHLARLERSLTEIGIAPPMHNNAWTEIMSDVAARNNIRDGFVYLEITRGPAERDFAFPRESRPTMLVFARERDYRNDPLANGISLKTFEDLRWSRRDIKSISLLAQVLAKQAARGAGANEALMHDNGVVTEGGSSNVWLVRQGTLITRPVSNDILAGVTRSVVLDLAAIEKIPVTQRAFTVDEAKAADEVFITSATSFVLGAVRIDDQTIADGTVGPITRRIRELYIAHAEANAVDRQSQSTT